MKKIYQIFIALLTISASLKGQVTVTATGGAFSGAYPTLKAAFDASTMAITRERSTSGSMLPLGCRCL